MVLFLCSNLASNTTGEQFVVDGGRSATAGAEFLHCLGHNPNCRPTGLCRLWPAADIAVEMLTAGLCQEET
jgi:hypothetical protein